MSGDGQTDPTIEHAGLGDGPSACVALVPILPSVQWSRAGQPLPRADSCFVTQLIATAEHAPQTCVLRRATSADAQTAYTAGQHPVGNAGIRTRHII